MALNESTEILITGVLIKEDIVVGFKVSDTDTAGDVKYYGYINSDGNWYIMREISSTGTYRFTRGTTDYDTAWAARSSQIYTLYNIVF